MDKTKIQLDKDKFLIIELDTHANEHNGVHVNMYQEQIIKVSNQPDCDILCLWTNPNESPAVMLPL